MFDNLIQRKIYVNVTTAELKEDPIRINWIIIKAMGNSYTNTHHENKISAEMQNI